MTTNVNARKYLDDAWPFWCEHAIVKQSGGLIDPGYLDAHDRMLCNMAAHFFFEAKTTFSDDYFADRIEHLSLVFIDNDTANARAIEDAEKCCIAVNLGLMRTIWALFHMGLSSDVFLADYLSCNVGGRLTDRDLSKAQWQQEIPVTWSEERQTLMHDLFARSLDFLILHEIGHHTRGHIDLLNQQMGFAFIDEASNASLGHGSLDALKRNIEFDADLDAIDMQLMTMDRDRAFSTWSSGQASDQYFLLSLAILATLQMFDLLHTAIEAQYGQSHPAPVHRAMRLVSALSRSFAELFQWTEEQRTREHDGVWYHGAQLAELLGMPEGRWRGSHSNDMGHDFFIEEEAKFLEFARNLDEQNIKEREQENTG